MTNPLLEPGELPQFSNIKPFMIKPAIEQLIEQNRTAISALTAQPRHDWDSLIKPLELMNDRLDKAWSPVRHLNSVKSSPELRDAYNSCLPVLSEYSTEISQNHALYQAYREIEASEEFENFDAAQRKTITDALLNFRLGGVELEGEARERYQQLQKDLSELQSSFENNLLDSTQAWQYLTEDPAELRGMPEYALSMLRQLAEQKNLPGYRLTLDMPCFLAVITYAENRDLRKEIYEAYVTRASDQGITDKIWDNAGNMQQIVAKRQEKAKLLGFANYAEYSLETKMAESVEQVTEFLQDLAAHSREAAIGEVDERQAFAESMGFEGSLQAWDYAYYSEKLKQQRYRISDEDLKPYFSDNRVINGLFEIVARLYQVRITGVDDEVDRWDDAVSFYQIEDRNGDVIGRFFLDLYARENKRGGAWMDECINRYRIDGKTQVPVAYLTCNLTPPIGKEPALFTHDEVITLFHEFGHGLHHMLTRVDVPDVAGINGVEWDAVELPSQFMENFCWERDALILFARHYQTDEPLPDELYRRMIDAKNFQSALQMLRQIEFSLFDIRLHQQTDISSAEQIQEILDEVRSEVSVVTTPKINRFQNGFSHIFAGGYAAGYYSYKWAEVLSADAFAAFEEEGIFNPETGQRFLQCVLEKGGSRPALESFRCFRGRDPQIDALLKHSGIN
ncbi:MAG: M3 family metallopeptidase [Gammaproteobacteria bacterium]|nr:M3 family metallopeptidase [Gammaproteobacteria bacterium]MDH3447181.1 M3 family metallopeptidase [Gammaproteobacteria bacterium]